MHDNKPINWRDHLTVHPAAELFPLLSETDPAALKELAEDIRQHGQREPASYIKDSGGNRVLLDGRNRLDALEMLGRKIDINDSRVFEQLSSSIDAQAFIISKNIHRRHLSAEDKRDLIGKLLKANPEKSDRQIATVTKADHKTVGAVRADLEGRGEIPHVEARTDTKGREQPARRLKHANPDCPDCGGNGYFKGGDSGRCHCHGSRPKKSTSPDCSRSGVSQVSTAPEKLSSGLLTGSDSPKTPIEQAMVAELEMQPSQSWTVVAIAEDGKRYGSGARFRTKEEARAYMVHAHRPLWEYAINEIRIAPSQDNPNCLMDRFDKGRDKGKVRPVCRVVFEHGTCGNLVWNEIDLDIPTI